MQVAIIGAIISSLGFGLANIVIKKALSNTSIAQTLLGSMISGSLLLAILVIFQGLPEDLTLQYLLILTGFAFGEVCLYLSLYKAFESSNVTLAAGIINTYPIFSTIYAVLIFGENINSSQIFSIILMVIGAIIISIEWSTFKFGEIKSENFIKGLPWAILALFIHSLYFPALGKLTESGDWEFKLLGIKIFASIILAIIFVGFTKSKFVFTQDKIMAGSLLGILEVIGWIGLTYASSNSTGMIALIVALGSSAPIVTAIGARIYLKEKLHILQYLGIVIVVIGLTAIALS